MKLQSMVSFVLEKEKELNCALSYNAFEFHKRVINYAKFLSQPLNLGMFIPCGEDGLPMKPYVKTESEQISDNLNNCRLLSKEECAYQKAVNRVLFEGFEICTRSESDKCVANDYFHFSYDYEIKKGATIQSLVKYDLTLTPTAVNQLNK